MKHSSGKAFTKELKQTCLNVYQNLISGGIGQDAAVTKASKMTGISRRSMENFLKESVTGTLIDNSSVLRDRKTIFETLTRLLVISLKRA